ncbi:MAG: hypothetical protein IPK80_13780 [Nannocystis sp.]|nr:hypothetical protein [Nannocystis sp.]
MIKHYLSLFTFASTLTMLSGCIIVSGGTDSDTDTSSSSTSQGTTEGTSQGTTEGTSEGTSAGTDSDSASTTEATTSSTTGESTTAAPETSSTTDDSTTAAPASGCGWNPSEMYYDCGPNGIPGEMDPEGEAPLNCPENQKLEEGQPCGPITNLGCCDPNGDVWFCEDAMLLTQICE